MNKDQFIAGYMPVRADVAPFDAAYTLDYHPHVTSRDLKSLNEAVNAMPYRADIRKDEILDPARFWILGGDCDKHALIKMLELRAQGAQDLYYVVLTDGPKGDAHAVLALPDRDGAMMALDNRFNEPVSLASLYKEYKPAYFIDVSTRRVWQAIGYSGT